jgi:hypothetical protein
MSSALGVRKYVVFFAILIWRFLLRGVNCVAVRSTDIYLGDWVGHGPFSASIVLESTNQTFPARPASFGPAFGDEFKGQLVRVAGHRFGCQTPLTEAGINETEFAGKVVLVQRGKCSYFNQIMYIQEMGGIAVIVGDDIPQDRLFPMYPDGIIPCFDPAYLDNTTNITIPSASVSLATYVFLRSFLSSNASPVDIIIYTSPLSDIGTVDKFLLLFFLFIIISLWIFISRDYSKPVPHASAKDLKALPCRRWKQEKYDKKVAGDISRRFLHPGFHLHTSHDILLECVICLEDFVEGDIVLTLPCDHDFHKACVYYPSRSCELMEGPHG